MLGWLALPGEGAVAAGSAIETIRHHHHAFRCVLSWRGAQCPRECAVFGEADQQHACTTYHALLQAALTVPAGQVEAGACGIGNVMAIADNGQWRKSLRY